MKEELKEKVSGQAFQENTDLEFDFDDEREERERINVGITQQSRLDVEFAGKSIFFEIRNRVGTKKLKDGREVPVFYDVETNTKDSIRFKLSRDEIILMAEAMKTYIKEGKEGFLNLVQKTKNKNKDGTALAFIHKTENSHKLIHLGLSQKTGNIILSVTNTDLQTKEKKNYGIYLDPIITTYIFDKIAEKSILSETERFYVNIRSRNKREQVDELENENVSEVEETLEVEPLDVDDEQIARDIFEPDFEDEPGPESGPKTKPEQKTKTANIPVSQKNKKSFMAKSR